MGNRFEKKGKKIWKTKIRKEEKKKRGKKSKVQEPKQLRSEAHTRTNVFLTSENVGTKMLPVWGDEYYLNRWIPWPRSFSLFIILTKKLKNNTSREKILYPENGGRSGEVLAPWIKFYLSWHAPFRLWYLVVIFFRAKNFYYFYKCKSHFIFIHSEKSKVKKNSMSLTKTKTKRRKKICWTRVNISDLNPDWRFWAIKAK